MSSETIIRSMAKHIEAAYEAVHAMNGAIPPQKNLANLPGAIDSIATTPSLTALKRTLKYGVAERRFPVGTEIPDTYKGLSSPWTVADYRKARLPDGSEMDGVYLLRMTIDETAVEWGASLLYGETYLRGYLNGQLPNNLWPNSQYGINCTEELKEVVTEITVPYVDATEGQTAYTKCRLWTPSAIELMASWRENEGQPFQLLKNLTGLETPSDSTNDGRIFKDKDDNPVEVWTRTCYRPDQFTVGVITPSGSFHSKRMDSGGSPIQYLKSGVLVGCFLGKDD